MVEVGVEVVVGVVVEVGVVVKLNLKNGRNNVNIEKLKEAIELAKLLDDKEEVVKIQNNECLWEVGKNYFIRTVTHHFTGKLEAVSEKELRLSTAAWIADSGRFSEALEKGVHVSSQSEIEPFKNPILINRSSIIDATIYDHDLPVSVK